MRLSAPIHRLKRAAKNAARENDIPLHAALDRVATREGFSSWSLLASKHAEAAADPSSLYASLRPGELVLVAARPRQGKTVLALQLALLAIGAGNAAHVFSLDDTPGDVATRLAAMPAGLARHAARLDIDCSDGISADHIMTRLADAAHGTLVVIDYLQLLDQKRTNPPLQSQVESLAAFAAERGAVMVFICQIDRAFDPTTEAVPGPADIRLPNPLDLKLFSRGIFLHGGRIHAVDRLTS